MNEYLKCVLKEFPENKLMTLYSANIQDLAKPVKKGKKKVEEKVEVPVEEPQAVKEKKPPTEKQLAARAKLVESRKRKREEDDAAKKAEAEAIATKQEEIKRKEEEIAEKKRVQAEKRKAKKEAALTTPPPSVEESVDGETKAVKQVRKRKRDDTEPPAWFNKFVESAKMEESKVGGEKKAIKQVKEEAKVAAKEQWQDGFTRDRVTNEVDSHMNRLYGMIFKRK